MEIILKFLQIDCVMALIIVFTVYKICYLAMSYIHKTNSKINLKK
jgi:hypothetical protein